MACMLPVHRTAQKRTTPMYELRFSRKRLRLKELHKSEYTLRRKAPQEVAFHVSTWLASDNQTQWEYTHMAHTTWITANKLRKGTAYDL